MSASEQRLTTQSIRSFVLRQGRMSPAQHHAYDTLMPRYGVPYAEARLDYVAAFGRSAPTILEIGCGMGETTAHIAATLPEKNFLGVEVHVPGVGALLKLIEQRGLANLRIIRHDAVEVVQHMIGANSLAGVHLFFPDPWPKARHHKRRIVQPPFVKLLASRIAPGGYLHCATDWEPYAEHMLEVISSEPSLHNVANNAAHSRHSAESADSVHAGQAGRVDVPAGAFVPRPAYRPVTKFETRGLKLGHSVRDLLFHKLP